MVASLEKTKKWCPWHTIRCKFSPAGQRVQAQAQEDSFKDSLKVWPHLYAVRRLARLLAGRLNILRQLSISRRLAWEPCTYLLGNSAHRCPFGPILRARYDALYWKASLEVVGRFATTRKLLRSALKIHGHAEQPKEQHELSLWASCRLENPYWGQVYGTCYSAQQSQLTRHGSCVLRRMS